MENKTKLIRVIVVVAIVMAVVIFGLIRRQSNQITGPAGAPPGGTAPAFSTRSSEIPKSITVPEATSTNVPADIAKPINVIPAAPGVSAKNRGFNISIDGDQFNPNKVVVNVGDTTNINFTAVDKNYDVFQPDYAWGRSIEKGETLAIGFQATAAGQFTFYCSSCGGPEKGPIGYLIVVKK